MAQWTTYIKDLNIPKNWECTSYGNDALPSYQSNGYHIWVDSWDEKERKINADCYNGECDSQCNECYENLFESDNFNDIINFVNKERN